VRGAKVALHNPGTTRDAAPQVMGHGGPPGLSACVDGQIRAGHCDHQRERERTERLRSYNGAAWPSPNSRRTISGGVRHHHGDRMTTPAACPAMVRARTPTT